MPSLVEIGPVVLEKKSKIGTVYRQTDYGQQAIRKAHLNFQLRRAKSFIKNEDLFIFAGIIELFFVREIYMLYMLLCHIQLIPGEIQILPCIILYKTRYITKC